jgi:lipopolysaccharide/colanic/teichoic acid biosynthesis glycosyltransferase
MKNFRLKTRSLVLIPENTRRSPGQPESRLRIALADRALAGVVFSKLRSLCGPRPDRRAVIALPRQWRPPWDGNPQSLCYYDRDMRPPRTAGHGLVISNGTTAAAPDWQSLSRWIADGQTSNGTGLSARAQGQAAADVVAVSVQPQLVSYREKALITSDSRVAGFRRQYYDLIVPSSLPTDWPHFVIIGGAALDRLLVDGSLPAEFRQFLGRCEQLSLDCCSVNIGGEVFDLDTETGMLGLLVDGLREHRPAARRRRKGTGIASSARFFGNVVLAENVQIGPDVIVAGPAVIAGGARIGRGAVIRNSIVGPACEIAEDSVVDKRVVIGRPTAQDQPSPAPPSVSRHRTRNGPAGSDFRTWPRFSYARCLKRIADIAAAAVVLSLFAPLMPLIAIAIKLNSKGPVFFKDRRQGLQGKEFFCLKFRTMIPGADTLQEKLRSRNEVDGPQFKVEDDPRVTMVGKFLRETFIDEMPQFINILLGHMSIVGPRPSPRAENSLCPGWRDARLSVRPGITGLWQVKRTRRTGCDFQEWIYYDTEYVKNLSLGLDLLICWQTAKKLVANLFEQF